MDNSAHHLRIYEPVFCLHESNGLAHFSSPHLFCLKLTIHTFFFFRSFLTTTFGFVSLQTAKSEKPNKKQSRKTKYQKHVLHKNEKRFICCFKI